MATKLQKIIDKLYKKWDKKIAFDIVTNKPKKSAAFKKFHKRVDKTKTVKRAIKEISEFKPEPGSKAAKYLKKQK